MDDDREGLSDIDRALAAALDVDVSPEFVARVRRRVASEPKPVPFWPGWRIVLPLAVATVAIAVVGAAILSTRGHSVAPFLAARPLEVGQLRPADVRLARPVLAVDSLTPVSRSRVASVSATAGKGPEVLVPQEDIEMYRRLIATAQNMPHALVVEAPQDIVAVRLISEITIDPIRIDPIVPPIGGEGDRQ
jgi:hypothetical protein